MYVELVVVGGERNPASLGRGENLSGVEKICVFDLVQGGKGVSD